MERPARQRPSRRTSQPPVWRSPIVLFTAAGIVLAFIVIALAAPKGPAPIADLRIPPTSYAADLTDGDVLGSTSAPVVLELYADFQCPACKQFVTVLLPGLVNDFVKPGTLRIEAHDIDIVGRGDPNESVELAAGAYCAAQQDRYWQFHDLVFWNQGRENRGDHGTAFIQAVADRSGVERTAWDACFATAEARQPVEAETTAALAAGVSSTPTLIVNGQSVVDWRDYNQLADLIRQQAAASASPS